MLFEPITESQYNLAPTTNPISVECSYQGHPFWNKKSEICLILHLLFVKYASTHTRTTTLNKRRALLLFMDFLAEYNLGKPSAFKITNFGQITKALFSEFKSYIHERKDISRSVVTNLKTLLDSSKGLDENIPHIEVGRLAQLEKTKTEPFSDETFHSLSRALTTHTEKLYQKLEFRKEVAAAKPYTFDEIKNQLINSKLSKSEVFEWAQHRIDNGLRIQGLELKRILLASEDVDLLAIASQPNMIRKFHDAFDHRDDKYRFDNPSNPVNLFYLHNWEPNEARLVRTFLEYGLPMDFTKEALKKKSNTKTRLKLDDCKDVIDLCLYRLDQFQGKSIAKPLKTLDETLALYFPTMMDMACLVMFIMLQTNWNKETVTAIDTANMEHPLTGVVKETQAIIHSEKNRSQGLEKPYYSPKEIIAVSSTTDRYSAYNLIKLADALSEPLKQYPIEYLPHGKTVADLNFSFLCLRQRTKWCMRGGRHTSISLVEPYPQGVKDFLSTYEVLENGARLSIASEITRRLRPTWLLHNPKRGDSSIGVFAMQMGHSDPRTTDVHYDSSAAAMRERKERLRSEQEEIILLLRQGKYEGLIGRRDDPSINLPLKIFHIPGMERPLWACIDQYNPTWHGHENYVEKGRRCYTIRKCLFCKNCNIFDDSLPYLFQRRIHVVELIEESSDRDSNFSNSLENELSIINSIIDSWDDPETTKEASRYQRRNDPLLPRDLDALQTIFEEEDMK